MSASTLYLVRHGAVIRVSGKTYIGQIEAPLCDEGVEQAWALRKWLDPVRFTQVFSSDLSRAQRTCRIIAGQRSKPVQIVPQLREIHLGEWEGISFREIEQRFPEEFAARGRDMEHWRPPGGESFADCHERVHSALAGILENAAGEILVVGHAGVNRLILCDILGMPIANLHSLGQDYGCVNVIDYSAPAPRVRLLNYVPRSTRPVERITDISPANTVPEARR